MSKASRRKQDEAAPPLHEAMQAVFRMTQISETGKESRRPSMFLWAPDGALTVVALAVEGAGPQFACAARLMVFKEEPAVAVISVEAWDAQIDPHQPIEKQDPALRDWLERRARGEDLGVKDLPPPLRGETLNLIGEDQEGAMLDWMYRITPPEASKSKRTFTRMEGFEVRQSIFHPMFLLPWSRRNGISEDQARASLRNEMRQCGMAQGLF